MKVFGVARVTADGQELRSKADAELTFGGSSFEEVIHPSSKDVAEVPQMDKVKCTLSLGVGDPDPIQLHKGGPYTIAFITDVGKTYVIRDAWSLEQPTMKGGAGGEMEFTFGGQDAEPVTAGAA